MFDYFYILVIVMTLAFWLKNIFLTDIFETHPLSVHQKVFGKEETDSMKWMFGLSKTKLLKDHSQHLTKTVKNNAKVDMHSKYLHTYFHPDAQYIKWNPHSTNNPLIPRFVIDFTPTEVMESQDANSIGSKYMTSVKRNSELESEIHDLFVFVYGEDYDKQI